jgi:hypothetical protein
MSVSGKRKHRQFHESLLTTAVVLLLAGCSSSLNLKVKTQIPTPVVTRMPLVMGVHFSDKFRNYVYQENSEDRQNWHIDNSASRLALFRQVLPSMFKEVRDVPGTKAPAGVHVDAIISPEVEDMQLALPKETYSDLYEAWIKYKIQLYRPDGKLIGEWPITGYGKAEKGFFTSRSKGLNTAIDQAMRDIGAKLSIGFPKQEVVQQWLASRTNEYHAEARP